MQTIPKNDFLSNVLFLSKKSTDIKKHQSQPEVCVVSCLLSYSTCSTVEEGAEQLDLCLELCQPEVNCLVVEDGLLEDLPLSCVLDSVLNDVVHRGYDWR